MIEVWLKDMVVGIKECSELRDIKEQNRYDKPYLPP